MSYSRYDDRRYSSGRRDSPQSMRRDRDRGRDSYSIRRPIAGPSRARSPPPSAPPRDENELPVEFGRPLQVAIKEDENTVLKRMKTAFSHSPLSVVYQCVKENEKIKVWTRNFKEVRGICTGYVVAFDKHWNLILCDVEEVYMKPKKAKTPYLFDTKTEESLQELPPKEPRKKKTSETTAAEKAAAVKKEAGSKVVEEEAEKEEGEIEKEEGEIEKEEGEIEKEEGEVEKEEAEEEKEEGEIEKKREERKKRKKGRKIHKRVHKQLFIRGDNIVLCALFDSPSETSSKRSQK